jgi:hypothetical protein
MGVTARVLTTEEERMHLRKALRILLAVSIVSALVLAVVSGPAGATTTATGTIVYNGSNTDSRTLIDTGLFYIDGCSHGDLAIEPDDPTLCFPDDFPGTLWGRAQAGIDFTLVDSQTADVKLDAPDSFRQDTTAPFSVTLTAKDAAGKEVKVTATPWIDVDLAYDAPLANCPKSTITNLAELDAADTSGCLNIVVHTGQTTLGNYEIFAKDMLLPYTGDNTVTDSHPGPALDVGLIFLGIPDLIKVRLDLDVVTKLTATGGFHGDRVLASASDPGTPLATDTLTFPSADPLADNVQIPCSAPAGDNLVYQLKNNKWDGTGKVDVKPKIVLDTALGDIDFPLGFSVNLFNAPLSLPGAPDFSAGLGEIKPDAKPPVIHSVTAPNGQEGSPITFSANATDNCGTPTLRWDFSDGGVAYGDSVQHTFNDNGTFSGLVTATDAAGNTAMKTFSVTVSNVTPTANAGPDTTADWGRPVAFNGQGFDPSSVDQSTLQYSWSFGDGTPSATGGPNAIHSYASPGDYTATLQVCDKDAACHSDTRVVHVTKRDTTTALTGAHAGTFDTGTSLGASLVDEYGQAVNGRTISFAVGADGPMTASTNSSGIASRAYTPTLGQGSYTGSAAFAGDSLYNSSGDSTAFGIARKATTTTYTGAKTGGPNKEVVLSAVLTDATGKPLAGKTVTFQLGSQGPLNATTNSSGAASTTLKLSQKNGTYTVSATYAGDADYYLGSSQGVIFKLQAK